MKDIAQRIVNAEASFVDNIVSQLGFTHEEATTIFDIYKNKKVIKLQLGIGRYRLSHGIFWDRQIMANALLNNTG